MATNDRRGPLRGYRRAPRLAATPEWGPLQPLSGVAAFYRRGPQRGYRRAPREGRAAYLPGASDCHWQSDPVGISGHSRLLRPAVQTARPRRHELAIYWRGHVIETIPGMPLRRRGNAWLR